MSFAQVGTCSTCGAPIYAESPWYGTCPPPSQHSCGCHGGYTITTSPTTDTVDSGRPNQFGYINPPWDQGPSLREVEDAEVGEKSTKKAIEELGDMLESEDLLELSEVDKLKSEIAGLSNEIEALGKLVVDFINHSTEKESLEKGPVVNKKTSKKKPAKKKALRKKIRPGKVLSD